MGFGIAIGGKGFQLGQTILRPLANIDQLFLRQQRLDVQHQTTAVYVLGFDEGVFLLQIDEVGMVAG